MSERYPGGFITKNAPQPTGGESGVADGIWTLEQALEYKQAGTWPIPVQPVYVEDVFSTYLYTGTNANQSINNGIDLLGKGGLVWNKVRAATGNTSYHYLVDTVRGRSSGIASNASDAEYISSAGNDLSSFTSTGYNLGPKQVFNASNFLNAQIVSWTFRKQPKFFDIVTYTGNGVNNRTISHSLGSTPGCVIIKRLDSAENWAVNHRGNGIGNAWTNLSLNQGTGGSQGVSQNYATSTTVNVTDVIGASSSPNGCNVNGATYVAYLFAHNAGGFGPLGTDNVISCGSFTTNASGGVAEQTLGYEPQFAIFKQTTSTGDRWRLVDNMRGMFVGTPYTGSPALYPNVTDAESPSEYFNVSATGFSMPDGTLSGSQTYIYIAIRRGPMKTPTSGTSVFAPYVTNTVAASSSGSTSGSALYRSDFVTDFVIQTRKASITDRYTVSRLTGDQYLVTNSTAAEATSVVPWDSNIAALNFATNYGQWMFRRAPGFFDVVCYTGTGSARTVNHNLGVVPELMIVKTRTESGRGWAVYAAPLGATKWLRLELNNPEATVSTVWNNTTPTSSVFTVGISAWTNNNTQSFVNYLFASCPGVSKIGSYIGNGSTQNINCDFVGSARFILIKKSEGGGGNWLVFDSARGITAGNDPVLTLNTTDAETNTTDLVNANTGGFQVVSPGGGFNDPNENNCTYIFLAIA